LGITSSGLKWLFLGTNGEMEEKKGTFLLSFFFYVCCVVGFFKSVQIDSRIHTENGKDDEA